MKSFSVPLQLDAKPRSSSCIWRCGWRCPCRGRDFGDADGAAGLLVVFEDVEKGASDGEGATVDGCAGTRISSGLILLPRQRGGSGCNGKTPGGRCPRFSVVSVSGIACGQWRFGDQLTASRTRRADIEYISRVMPLTIRLTPRIVPMAQTELPGQGRQIR